METDLTGDLSEIRIPARSMVLCYDTKADREFVTISNNETGETVDINWNHMRDTVFEWNERLTQAQAEVLDETEN